MILSAAAFASSFAESQGIPVRETLGTSRAFIVIRDDSGKQIGHGEFSQTTHGTTASSILSLRFRDGSLDEETSRYSQGRTLRLISDHHLQRGPMFPTQLDMTVNAGGHVSITTIENGKESKETDQKALSASNVNGLIGVAILNLPPALVERKYDFIAPVGKGRKIQLRVTPERQDKFLIADTTVKAQVYRIHYELGGLTGLLAPMIGKQPEDSFVWVTTGVPSLVREQAALYSGGPILSLELAGATFDSTDAEANKKK